MIHTQHHHVHVISQFLGLRVACKTTMNKELATCRGTSNFPAILMVHLPVHGGMILLLSFLNVFNEITRQINSSDVHFSIF